MEKPVIERLMAKVDKHDGDGCWLWAGTKIVGGYGQIRRCGRKGKMELVHRVSFEILVGPIPDGLFVCHSCDVRNCVNPAHLFLGTQKDNMADAMNKGRMKIPDSRGEAHGNAKLTEEGVREIRARRLAGDTQQAIATHFGVSKSQVSRIMSGETWAHVS